MGPGEPGECTGERSISAVLAPHAGYECSGTCAAHAFKALAEDGRPDAYIVIGPDHYGVPYETVMCSDDYLTPLGRVPVHKDIAARLRQFVPDDPRAHFREHSIEVELPFIQYIDPKAQVVPIIMSRQTPGNAERLAEAVKTACLGYDVVIVASSDLVHYVPHSYAEAADADFLKTVAAGEPGAVFDTVRRNGLTVCGYGPIAVAMMLSAPGRIKILNQTDSAVTLGMGYDSCVGYGSAVMYKPGR
jgi:AmmeMemoRadiSam system protein B